MNEEDPELSREELLQRYGSQAPRASGSERRSPFKFLDSYDLEDADIFFGRDTEIEELLGHFRSYGHVLIYGESGSGKSSLVQCGLRSQIPEADALFIPLRVHTTGLPTVCHQICESASQQLGEAVEESPEAGLVETLRAAHDAASRPIVLFFDQFEELFIFHDSEVRRRFAEELASIRTERLNVKMMIGVRQDYLGHLSELEATVEGLFDNRFWLRRMSRENAAQAVVKACATCEVTIKDELAQAILHRLDPGGQGVELPYLQVVMDRLYRQAVAANPADPVITAGEVEQLGDITDILGTFLVEEVGKLPSPDTGRQILKAFVTREGTRRNLDRAAVGQEAAGFGAAIPQDVLDAHVNQLASVRILREIADTDSYELRHDALAATVAGWISEVEKELIEVRDNLVNRFKEYEARDRDTGALLDQGFLDYLAVYRERLKPLLNDALHQYVEDSERHVGQAARVRRRVRQIVTGVVGSIILGCLVVALWQWQKTKRQLDLNRIQEGLLWVERADRFLDQQPKPPDRFAATLMAARAIGFDGYGRENADQDFKDEYLDFLKGDTAEGHRPRAQAILEQPVILPVWQSPLYRHHDGPIDAVGFHTDGEMLVSGSSVDGIFKLWIANKEKGDLIRAIGSSPSEAISVAISADGKTLATGNDKGVLSLWNTESGRLVRWIKAGGYDESVSSLAFSPEGLTIASGSSNGSITIWKLSDGTESAFMMPEEGLVDLVESVSFSPDGERIASGSKGGTVSLWGIKDRTKIKSESTAHNGLVYDVAFSPDGKILASGGKDGLLKLWNGETGKATGSLDGHASEIRCVSFAPDGNLLACGRSDGTIQLWDVEKRKVAATKRGSQAGVRSLSFSADGKTLVSGGETGLLQFWDVTDRTKIEEKHPRRGAQGVVTSVAISSGGKFVASGAKNGTVKLWDVAKGQESSVFHGHPDSVSKVAFSPDGETLTSTGADGDRKFWSVSVGEELSSPPDGPATSSGVSHPAGHATIEVTDVESGEVSPAASERDDVTSNALSADGRLRATGNAEGEIRIWDLRSGNLLTDITGNPIGFLAAHRATVHSLAFSSDGQTLVSGSEDGTVKIWRLQTGPEIRSLAGHDYTIYCAASGPDDFFASGDIDGTIKLWLLDRETDAEMDSLTDPNKTTDDDEKLEKYVNSMAFDPAGRFLAVGTGWKEGRVKLLKWEHDGNGSAARIKVVSDESTDKAPLCVALSTDGTILASGHAESGIIRLWNLETGESIEKKIGEVVGHAGSVKSVAFRPGHGGNPILASAGNDGLVKLWECKSAENGDKTLQPFKDSDDGETGPLPVHKAEVWSVAFSPDGTTLASGGLDQLIKLWDADTGKIRTFEGHKKAVSSLAFSRDGKLLASGSEDGILSLWDVETGERVHSHPAHINKIVGLFFRNDGKTLESAGESLIKIWEVKFLVSNELPDLAAYLSQKWLKLDETEVRWRTTTDKLFAQPEVFKYVNYSPFSDLGKLLPRESGTARSK